MTQAVPDATRRAGVSTRNRIGLVLLALVAVSDVANVFVVPEPAAGEAGPPREVLLAGAALAVVTLVAAAVVWRSGGRAAARVVAGSRVLAAVLVLPAFFAPGVPAGLVLAAASYVLLTAVGVYLVLRRS
jgi:hypothetical protein